MKKSVFILICTILSLGLLAFGYNQLDSTPKKSKTKEKVKQYEFNYYLRSSRTKKEEVNFFYDFGPRFQGIKRSTVQNAETVNDFLSQDEIDKIDVIYSVNVIVIKNDERTNINEKGFSGKLTCEQIDLLRSLDYSSNFLIETSFIEKIKGAVDPYNSYTPHMTIVPEKQAEYKQGKETLLAYMDIKNKKNTFNLDQRKLQPAKLYFTVTKNGLVENLHLDSSCGYSTIDIEMIEIITNTAGKWTPAENAKGEKMDQELVVSFGMVGC